MFSIVYDTKVLKKFKTKYQAKQFIDSRLGLCYMLRINPQSYSIVKGNSNASRKYRKKRSMS